MLVTRARREVQNDHLYGFWHNPVSEKNLKSSSRARFVAFWSDTMNYDMRSKYQLRSGLSSDLAWDIRIP